MARKTDEFDISEAIANFLESNDDPDYNQWFTFFQKIPAFSIQDQGEFMLTTLPSDGYAAYRRWEDIFANPDKMEKVIKSKMEEARETDITELAIGDDDEAFYKGMITEAARQLNSGGVSPQEVARLTANINIFRKGLSEIRSRTPKEGTVLARVLSAASDPQTKNRKKIQSTTKKAQNKTATTPVKKHMTASKAAGATKTKKTGKVLSKGGK